MRSTLLSTVIVLSACGAGSLPGDDSSATSTAVSFTDDSGAQTATQAVPTTTDGIATTGDDAGAGTTTGTTGTTNTTNTTGATVDASTTDFPDTTGDDATTGGAVPGAFCGPIPACDAAPPMLPGQGSEDSGYSRGRDMFYVEGEPQWVLAKFTKWGFPLDKDIVHVPVHIFLDRDCAGAWEELGTSVTTDDGEHAIVEGVKDSGGRVYFQIPAEKALGLGRHRVHMIDEDQWETAEALIDVVPQGTPFFVSDVDGTLTVSENEEAYDFLLGSIPDPNPFAAQALSMLASKGYRPMYMTARPEWLDRRTREFVALHDFPRGIIHTTTTYGGANGAPAAAYKTEELAMLEARGLVPAFAFGNRDTDALAYDNAAITPAERRILYQFTDTMFGARRIDSYEELLGEFAALPDLCR